MKKIFICLSLVLSTALQAQNDESLSIENDTLELNVKRVALGVKLGMPNIIGGSLEFILPVLDNHFAPYADLSGFDIDPDTETSVGLSYSEFGLNYYLNTKGRGLYFSAGLGNLTTDITISNLNVPNENGISANDGVGTVERKISSGNIKLGVRAGSREYFRFELGYGFGSIPSEINILATSASLGITENVTEPFPDIPGLSSAGVIIGNIGFGIAF